MAVGSYRLETWQSTAVGLGVPRKDRASGAYRAYIPDPLVGRSFSFDAETAADVDDATSALARFDEKASALTNTESLARLLLRAESVASSHIEGLSISPQRLLRADATAKDGTPTPNVDPTAREVLANVEAMTQALAHPHEPITVERILEVHRQLLENTNRAQYAGVIRTEQNWIGGSDFTPIGAAFIPPPPDMVPGLLKDLVAFCNEASLPAVAQAAMAHSQFETIHPFADGNGRTGRALIYMVLQRRALVTRATPPISLVLATFSRDYIRGLDSTRFEGSPMAPKAITDVNAWISFFAASCVRAVGDAEMFESRVAEIIEQWRSRLTSVRSNSSAVELLSRLPGMPVFTVGAAAQMLGRTFAAVNNAVEVLVLHGIVMPVKAGGRNRLFEARELVDAFTALERQLASPERNTRISLPARPVPARPRRS